MLCQDCHKNAATVRYAEVVDGKVSQIQLCQECLNNRQVSVKSGFEFTDPTPIVKKPDASSLREVLAPKETCPSCATELQTILDTGNVGCSTCYESFPAQLESIMEGLHSALTHRGKVPRVDDARRRIRSELQSKRALLKTALRVENYEEAAALRDEIRSLETGLGAAEAGAD